MDLKTAAVQTGSHLIVATLAICLIAIDRCNGQDVNPSKVPQRWAVIFVGLPGDTDHEAEFRKTADQLLQWLTGPLQFPEEHIVRLPGSAKSGGESVAPLTAEAMRTSLADVTKKLQPDDTFWLLTLGHGNYDGKRSWFHVAGKDPSNEDVGRWLADVNCREQVIWLTQSSSGWFLKPLSRPGRIVITATAADDESNETEFPHALATIAGWPIDRLDRDQDKAVSVAELYAATIGEVLRRFQSDKRLPTEHPMIDDNGDGVGTEDLFPAKSDGTDGEAPKPPSAKVDGDLAKRTLVPYRVAAGDEKPEPKSQ